MFSRIAVIPDWLRRLAASRAARVIENLALRRLRPRCKEVLVIIQPDTVVRRHRTGFWKYWMRTGRRGYARSTADPSSPTYRD